MSKAEPIHIGGIEVPPGSEHRLELPVARLVTGSWLSLPVAVLNGRGPGPRLWLSAALHGDELNGMEIIRRVVEQLDPRRSSGTVIAVPIVNVFGFEQQTRYLPDRRDLNRTFPGSPRGSLAAQLAHLFVSEVVDRCQYGVDLHSGSNHRSNLPQIRADLEDPETRRLASVFGAPMMYHAPPIRGSLRTEARKRGVRVLVYEAGEPLRFNSEAIETGVRGVLNVLSAVGVWSSHRIEERVPVFEARERRWIRATRSGIFHLDVELGEQVQKGQAIGYLADPFMRSRRPVRAGLRGVVIGFTNNPLVYKGEALVHLAKV